MIILRHLSFSPTRPLPTCRRLSRPMSTFSSSVTPIERLHVEPKSKIGANNNCIGIVREVYNKWERRCPLAPQHVQVLKKQGYRILIQPSSRRVYTNEEYALVGAELTEDLAPANVILGVKQVPVADLLPNRTYMFFSHTIKAQSENMALLDALLEKKIRFIDYECITDTGERAGQRLVAFGRFAGIAGFIDILQGLGQNLLARGFNSPFLHSPSTYMYRDLETAKANMKALGDQIRLHGLAHEISPLIFAFTGKGKVSQGAQEIFKLLPHEWVSAKDLPDLVNSMQAGKGGKGGGRNGRKQNEAVMMERGTTTPPSPSLHKLYGVMITEEDMVERLANHEGGIGFNRSEYREYPERYRPIFHERIAPYVSVLINGVYWDHRYPRLLSKAQLKQLAIDGRLRLLAISDISCDVEGSLELLSQATEIEKPFLNYRPDIERMDAHIDGKGIVVCGVDILPSELPKEATEAFGDALLPLLPHLVASSSTPYYQLPAPLQGAIITSNGELTDPYRYITFLRHEKDREKMLHDRIHGGVKETGVAPPALPHVTIKLIGHVFDSGLINQVLDVVEGRGGSFRISECMVRANRGQERHKTTVVLEIEAQTKERIEEIVTRVKALANLVDSAEATVTELLHDLPLSAASNLGQKQQAEEEKKKLNDENGKDGGGLQRSIPSSANHPAVVKSDSPQRVLVLGAGRVAGPALGYLGQDGTREVTVVGMSSKELSKVHDRAKWARPVVLDVGNETAAVKRLIQQADVVVSILPAPMHPRIAKMCLDEGRHLVTSSYVSEEMKALHQSAAEKGLIFLNECGLDPGMDHLSAMKIMDEAKARGGIIQSYRSVCGGLPAPDAAATNPFLYKFSWSPRAVLTAAQNSAMYLEDGRLVKVNGEQLLTSARKADDVWPTLNLEVLPNRDSVSYGKLYGIPEAHTVFRGTLRYHGWSELIYGCLALGLFQTSRPHSTSAGHSWRQELARLVGVFIHDNDKEGVELLKKAILDRLWERGVAEPAKVLSALEWLGLLQCDRRPTGQTIIDSFCQVLEQKLGYGEHERDMVLMRHDITVMFPPHHHDPHLHHHQPPPLEHHTSSLLVFGNEKDSAMALTVGTTTALATELVLQETRRRMQSGKGGNDGKSIIKERGVLTPLKPEIYLPLLDGLKTQGMEFQESVKQHTGVGGEETKKQHHDDQMTTTAAADFYSHVDGGC